MKTHCNQETFEFQTENSRKIVAHFNGGNISSDAGGLLLKQTEQATGIINQFAGCFNDHRDPDLIEHTAEDLIAQRIYALALGYEDLNDHDELRNDPLLALLVGKKDPTGRDRIRKRDKGKALAGKSTLNRLELTPIRADSGFCREPIMFWCEQNNVDYVLGLAKNERLKKEIAEELQQAKELYKQTGQAARVYKDFEYQTLKSWRRSRRVVGKAEYLQKGENPRFVVTSLSIEQFDAKTLYQEQYCARGDMENRIKEQQLYLFADRTSAATMRANQLRLWFSSVAYTLLNALRRLGLKGTKLAKAQCGTIRLKLLKIGAQIKVTVRKVWVSLSESYPYQQLFGRVYENLKRFCPTPMRC